MFRCPFENQHQISWPLPFLERRASFWKRPTKLPPGTTCTEKEVWKVRRRADVSQGFIVTESESVEFRIAIFAFGHEIILSSATPTDNGPVSGKTNRRKEV